MKNKTGIINLLLGTLLVLLTLSLYACFDKKEQPQTSQTSLPAVKALSACDFLTAEEIKEVFETEVEKEIGVVDSMVCTYKFKSGNYHSISLTLRSFKDSETAYKVFNEKLKSIKKPEAVQKVFNLGKDAFWLGKDVYELNILKENNIFVISVATPSNVDESELSAKCILLSEKFIK
jgi:hypothetical protein